MVYISGINTSFIESQLKLLGNKAGIAAANIANGQKTDASISDIATGYLQRSRISTLKTAIQNAGQGRSLLKTAKGASQVILDLLEKQQALATRANDASLSQSERLTLNLEFQSLTKEINRIATTTAFNNRILLNGSLSGKGSLTSATGQSIENYTLLSTSNYSLSGTIAAGELATSNAFSVISSTSVGKVAGSAVLDFTSVSGAVTNAIITVGGQAVTFSSGATAAAAATAFVAAAEASTNNTIRSFTYNVVGNTVVVTGADAGTAVNSIQFALTNTGGGIDANGVTFGGDNIDTTGAGSTESITSATTKTLGTNRSVDSGDLKFDPDLQGKFSNFDSTLSTAGTQNTVTFSVKVNDRTYTSKAVTLYGTGGYNSKGNTIKSDQVITFYDTDGETDDNGEYVESAFTLTTGPFDITISGGDQTAFEADLDDTAAGFESQLEDTRINQDRDLVFGVENEYSSDFDVKAADDTVLEGIQGYDKVGTNTKADIRLISDSFGSDGNHGKVEAFNFDRNTHVLTTKINGEVYTADLSDSNDYTGTYNSATNTLTTDGTIILSSASTTDNRQLRINLNNVDASEIIINSETLEKDFEEAFDKVFEVEGNETLAFQVGDAPSNKIEVAIEDLSPKEIYKDDDNIYKDIDVTTEDNAALASEVLENAVNKVLSELSTIEGGISSFDSAIATNTIAAENADAARALLLDTDFAEESTRYALFSVRAEAAAYVLMQIQLKMRHVLRFLERSSL